MANVTLSSMATEAAIQYGRLFYIIRLESHFLLKLEEWIIHNEKLEEDKLPKSQRGGKVLMGQSLALNLAIMTNFVLDVQQST